MNDRDCESCKKFSRIDPYESEGHCDAKRTWVDPQEGEECKMHEFTLHSATKYKDGTPIMSEPEKVYCESDADLIHGMVDSAGKVGTDSSYAKCKAEKNSLYGITAEEASNQLDYLERAFKGFAKTQDDLIEEYDATLKAHGETLEDHHERITINEGNIDAISSDVEDLQRKVAIIYQFINSVAPGTFFKVMEEFKRVEKENIHNGSDFCGNCTHCDHDKQGDDTIYICTLSHEFVDPDDSSCAMFEPPF